MSTLEVRIRDKMNFFLHRKQVTLPCLKDELTGLQTKFAQLRCDTEPRLWYDVRERVDALTREVEDIELDREQTEYLLDIIPFVKAAYDELGHSVEDSDSDTDQTAVPDALRSTVHVNRVVKHGKIYSDYMSRVEKTPTTFKKPSVQRVDICPHCGSHDVVDETATSAYICRKCAIITTYLGNTRANLTYEQDCELDHTKAFSYKKISRFNEIISQFQARQNVDIPDDVMGQLRAEIKKLRLHKSSDITPKRIRQLLKKLDHQKFYSSTIHICKLLGGETPPPMTPELEDRLRQMFLQTLDPFDKIIKTRKEVVKDRQNYLSYPYSIYKLLEILGEKQYMQHFSQYLLKSTDKLYVQDRMWKAVCGELNWTFTRTV